MGYNWLTCIFANAMQQSSSIAIATGTQIWSYHKKVNGHLRHIILTKLVDFVCVEVLRPSQPNGVMSSTVSLPNHTFTGQA